MDPLSIVSGSLAIAKVAASLVAGVQEVWSKYAGAQGRVHGLVSLLHSLKVAMNTLSRNMTAELMDPNEENDVKSALAMCLRACATLMRELNEQVTLLNGLDGRLSRWWKAKYVWKESDIVKMEERLDRQVNALNFFLNVLVFQQHPQQCSRETMGAASSAVVVQATDDASTFTCPQDLDTITFMGIELDSSVGRVQPERTAQQPVRQTTSQRSFKDAQPSTLDVVPAVSALSSATPPTSGSEERLSSEDNLDPEYLPNLQLKQAINERNQRKVEIALRAGANPNLTMKEDLPLVRVIYQLNSQSLTTPNSTFVLDTIQMLLNYGADINKNLPNQFSSLEAACYHDYEGTVTLFLIDRGADVNQAAENGRTPLHIACHKANEAAIWILLQKGAKACVKANPLGWTALHWLVHGRTTLSSTVDWKSIIHILLEAGLSINAPDSFRHTPLCYAVYPNKGRNLDLIRALVNEGADVHTKYSYGDTLFHGLQLPIDDKDKGPGTDIKVAREIYDYLISCGADPNIRNERGELPNLKGIV